MAETTDDYSRDADQTRFIYIIGIIALFTLLGLFALEFVAMLKGKGTEASKYAPFIFTSEIVHALLPVTVGVIGLVAGFLFGRESGKAQMRNGGGQK